MCKPDNIQKLSMFVSFMKVIEAISLISIGSMLASTLGSTLEFQLAYGARVVDIAGGLILAGLLLLFGSCIGHIGSQRHNKCLLLCIAAWDTIVLIIHLALAAGLLSLTISNYDAEFRDECVRNSPGVSRDKCNAYAKSERYLGMKMVWAAKFKSALSDPNDINTMQIWEADNKCCGFGAPKRCVEDEGDIPDYLSIEGVPKKYAAQGTVCGDLGDWYPGTALDSEYECEQINADDVVGGCKFEMPAGPCKIETVEDSSIGCASWLQTKMDGDMILRGYVVYALAFFEVMSILLSCCHCWKRREIETLPAYLEAEPWDPYANGGKMKPKINEIELVDE